MTVRSNCLLYAALRQALADACVCTRGDIIELLVRTDQERLTEIAEIVRQVTEGIDWVRRKARVLIAALGAKSGSHVRGMIERPLTDMIRNEPE